MLKQINPIDLSRHVIKYVNDKGHEVSHLKLQKLIYYVDAWHNVYFNQPLIEDQFEAWMHGPVVRNIWNYFRDKSVLYDPIKLEEGYFDISEYISSEQLELINDVLDEYGDKTAYYLECLTHSEEPWRRARLGYAPSDKCEAVIYKDLIKQFYGSMLYGKNTED
ncbi:prophage ps3 protein 01 [Desulfofarcimen acetoxidans DSM 771]|uniref:Prophage ps3 protein 01 n=1 Tax=Desulfofarcimen acetoxidans (strain ATCC 49208 / DSM 771 / KCTC 5769 / VKM B-1644 / 5575) TaxID=485916 RepID=C8VXX4_DESAS|nr:type II toxin-antitoxin system antitoxin SocA domain-containing protein [Desulfofarcimen acetoxidans]ACV64603.1 prophage ps3 protein 01 [Desulfofarcimen acetoxidans DSM 771]